LLADAAASLVPMAMIS